MNHKETIKLKNENNGNGFVESEKDIMTLPEAINPLTGLNCIGVVSPLPPDSYGFGIELGRWLPDKTKYANSRRERFEMDPMISEYALWIYCKWQIVNGDEIVTYWNDDNKDYNSSMVTKLDSLIGHEIVSVNTSDDGHYLSVHFDNGFVLSTCTTDDEQETYWCVEHLSHTIFTVDMCLL